MNEWIPNPKSVTYTPIGVIRSGHLNPDETPIQSVYAKGFNTYTAKFD